jgi:NAD(P)-dependent dehydrogenase (short-subunit alcohol dehydrogenase family)
MRAKKSGAIAFMGSIAGWEGGPACGLYCAVKFALAGVATSLREEVAPLGIKVVLMEPGYFRTDFLGARKVATKNKIDDYEPILAGMRVAFQAFHNNQPGDPAKGGKFIVDALTRSGEMAGRELPRRLLIGEDAVSFVIGVLDKERKALNEWKDLSVTTNL